MKVILLFLISFSAMAKTPSMGAYFFDAKNQDKIYLTCENGELAKDCEWAYFTLLSNTGERVLHFKTPIPMDDSQDSHYTRYYRFYEVRDTLVQERAIGPQPWVFYNTMKINQAFAQAVKSMFSKQPSDMNTGIKLSHGNFNKLIEVIGNVL